ncbi:ABC transporter ATP-binding protein, partial [Abiotrophia sp. HMSC24B09]|uniref:ABC transporter ATP-binding protein n=1 Tax=Abiotrophia sp. HMSC24B09 TaxID=1581061 RepID=UPI0025BC1884
MPNRAKTFGRLMAYMWRYKGTALMALVFIFLTSAVTTAIPLLARYYIDHFIGGGLVAQGGLILLAYYSLFLVRVAFTFLGNYTFARVAQSVVRDLRQESFDKLQSLSMRYFDQTPAGAIVSRLTNDTQAVADMFSAIFSSFLSSLVIVAVTIGTMLSLNVPLTLLMLVFIPIMFGSIALYNSKSRDLIAMTRAKLSDLNVKLSESIEGMRIVQAFGQEGRLLAEFEAINADHVTYSNKSLNVNSLFLRPAMSLLKLLAYAVILAYFGVTWQVAGVTAGLMYAFIQYSNQLFNPLIEVTQNFSILQTSMIAADRVFALIDQEDYEPAQSGQVTEIGAGSIEFQDVSFSYDGKRDVLKHISFKVEAGQTVAFVGATGSGKSSIMNLFLRFYEFDRGQILIDGQDIKSYSADALRSAVGLVLQDPFLFHGTIASNIR